MKKLVILSLVILSVVLSLTTVVGCQQQVETPPVTTSTSTPTPALSPPSPTPPPAPPSPTPTLTPTLTPTAPTPTPTPTETPTPRSSGIIDGDWISNEKNSDPAVSGAILRFTVRNGRIISLTVSVFPVPSEWFFWFIDKDKPLDIKENRFICSTSSLPASSGQGEFVLEGKFTAENRCEGIMKFPKGFFWVDFALDHDVTFTWTAQPK
ncbi:MAG TPA: hypothetical protein VGA82_04735 [Dehalococcoidales bacterium]